MIVEETANTLSGGSGHPAIRQASDHKDRGPGVNGHSDSHATTNALGWFSLGLGAAEFLFPKRVARTIGAPRGTIMMRLTGLREIGVGLGILAAKQKAGWIKARIAGDALDLAMLKSSFDSRRSNRVRLVGAMAGAAAVTAADVLCAQRLAAEELKEKHGARVRVEASMAINKPAAECYEFWRHLENFPKFMKHVESVQVNGDHSRWKVREGGATFEWVAEITEDVPGEVIAWRSAALSKIFNAGSVRFEPRLGARGTNVRLALEYDPPGGRLGGAANPFLKTISHHQVRENLRRFKSIMECGEFPATQGQPSGSRSLIGKGAIL